MVKLLVIVVKILNLIVQQQHVITLLMYELKSFI